ncbi:hypothetical protein [Nonomuraea insulae]|uniref:Uncharacterized protein n=1 Tax=Nonomuraea insulae TaxID=1616787 RepID=A0ABW1D523_9ACTN
MDKPDIDDEWISVGEWGTVRARIVKPKGGWMRRRSPASVDVTG